MLLLASCSEVVVRDENGMELKERAREARQRN